MISLRQGAKVYGPGVFMFEEEAALVKQELLARGTKTSKRLADEIGMPSDGTVYATTVTTGNETLNDIIDEMLRNQVGLPYDSVRNLGHRLEKALKLDRAMRPENTPPTYRG